jgi:hypothetical protein
MLPVVGRPSRYTFNVVPRDFVISAIEHLSALTTNVGRTYAIADPDPMTVDETIRTIANCTGRTIVRVPLTKWMAKASLNYVPGVYRLMRIPADAVDYFVHPTTYDTAHATADLASAGITAPRFRDYAPKLVDFVRAHPEIGSAAMV